MLNADGTQSEYVEKTYGKKPRAAAGEATDKPFRGRPDRAAQREDGRRPFKPRTGDDRPPRRSFRDAPDAEGVAYCASLGLDARPGRAEVLPFPDASFDHAVIDNVLSHTMPQSTLAEVYRVLKPGYAAD